MKNGEKCSCAFIEKVKDKNVTEKELIDFCKETLAGFKVPKKSVSANYQKHQQVKFKNLS